MMSLMATHCAVQAEGPSHPLILKGPTLKARLGDAEVLPDNEDSDTNQRLQEQREKEDNIACKLCLETTERYVLKETLECPCKLN